jgi:hypothetical protein
MNIDHDVGLLTAQPLHDGRPECDDWKMLARSIVQISGGQVETVVARGVFERFSQNWQFCVWQGESPANSEGGS